MVEQKEPERCQPGDPARNEPPEDSTIPDKKQK